MAPAQMIEAKDLPPEVLTHNHSVNASPQGSIAAEELIPLSESTPLAAPIGTSPALVNLGAHAGWESALEVEALQLLGTDRQDVWGCTDQTL